MSARSSRRRTCAGRVRVCAPVHPGAAGAQRRVDRAPVRARGAGGRAGVRARAGRRDRRGPRASRGSGLSERSGFARLAAEVALGHAGLVLGLEVSRLARNNADWYRLLDLCGVTDTVIGDADGLYHPGSFNDRLLLGLKGTMSEAELHVLRARLDGGIRNKAKRGELRRGLPVGLVWGERRRRGAAASRRGDPRRDHRDLRALRRARLGASGVAVAAPRGACSSPCSPRRWRDPLGRAELPPGAQRAHQPRLRRRLRVRQDAPRALRRRARPAAQADPSPRAGRLGGLDLGAPPRLHRPGDVRGQPGADRAQHAPARARAAAAPFARVPRCCKESPSAGAAGAS